MFAAIKQPSKKEQKDIEYYCKILGFEPDVFLQIKNDEQKLQEAQSLLNEKQDEIQSKTKGKLAKPIEEVARLSRVKNISDLKSIVISLTSRLQEEKFTAEHLTEQKKSLDDPLQKYREEAKEIEIELLKANEEIEKTLEKVKQDEIQSKTNENLTRPIDEISRLSRRKNISDLKSIVISPTSLLQEEKFPTEHLTEQKKSLDDSLQKNSKEAKEIEIELLKANEEIEKALEKVKQEDEAIAWLRSYLEPRSNGVDDNHKRNIIIIGGCVAVGIATFVTIFTLRQTGVIGKAHDGITISIMIVSGIICAGLVLGVGISILMKNRVEESQPNISLLDSVATELSTLHGCKS